MVCSLTVRPPIRVLTAWAAISLLVPLIASADDGWTSLTNDSVTYEPVAEHFAEVKRGPLQLILADNTALNLPQLPDHRAGYNGIASLVHTQHPQNLFVPGIAGLNFEHVHDGSTRNLVEKFEPRKDPMQLRRIDSSTFELYQPPTSHFQLESCGRYTVRTDGTIQYEFECIPRAASFRSGLIGLFWASYIHQPDDKAIWFVGRPAGRNAAVSQGRLLRVVSPRHGVRSTHGPAGRSLPDIDDDFPLTLVNHPSEYEYTEPWFYGISHGLAFVQVFRPQDAIWFAQSPSGGGQGNPAWDFQWFIRKAQVGQVYRFRMKAACVPFESHGQVQTVARRLAAELMAE